MCLWSLKALGLLQTFHPYLVTYRTLEYGPLSFLHIVHCPYIDLWGVCFPRDLNTDRLHCGQLSFFNDQKMRLVSDRETTVWTFNTWHHIISRSVDHWAEIWLTNSNMAPQQRSWLPADAKHCGRYASWGAPVTWRRLRRETVLCFATDRSHPTTVFSHIWQQYVLTRLLIDRATVFGHN